MKKLFLPFILIAFILSACHPVSTEDTDTKLSMPTSTPPRSHPTVTKVPIKFPETYQASQSFYNGKLNIHIDAKLHYQKDAPYDVYNVEDADFDPEIVDAVLAYFCGDQPLYTIQRPPTKAELEAYLIEYKSDIAEGTNDQSKEDQQAYITDLEQAILDAPHEAIHAPLDLSADHVSGYVDIGEKDNGSMVINRDLGYFVFNNGRDGYYHKNTDHRGYQKTIDDETVYEDDAYFVCLGISADDAIKEAQAFLQKTGIHGFTCRQAEIGMRMLEEGNWEENHQCYFLYFTKDLDGVPLAFDHGRSFGLTRGGGLYNEKIRISVDDDGIFDFIWENCSKIKTSTYEDTKLRSIDDIMDSFISDMASQFQQLENDDHIIDSTIDITEVRLEYIKVSDRSPLQTSSLIPAWSFYGRSINRILEKDGRILVSENDSVKVRHAYYSTYAIEYED